MSLLEVLVALVILVLGILTVARLFPAGLLAVRSAQNSSYADRLAQATLESLKDHAGSLPEDILIGYGYANDPFYPAAFDLGDPLQKTRAFPDSLDDYMLPSGAVVHDINKMRFIHNETLTVPSVRIPAGGSGYYPPVYALSFGPIALPAALSPSNLPAYLPVNSLPWSAHNGVSATSSESAGSGSPQPVDNPLDELSPGQPAYLVDYNAGKIAVAPEPYDQVFLMTIQVQQATATTYNLKLTVPRQDPIAGTNSSANYNGGWFSLTDTPYASYVTVVDPSSGTLPAISATTTWVSGSMVLFRPFQAVAYNGSQTFVPQSNFPDPYEYAVGPNLTSSSGTALAVNPGALQFNPLASGQSGTQPLKAQVSYTVYDWHVLHEDLDVPQTGAGTVNQLLLNHLKKLGDVQFDQSVYSGLVPNTNRDILLLNLDTGQLDPSGISNADDGTGSGPIVVGYEGGRVTLPASYGGQHLRIFYAGDDDWAVAIQKAARVYQPVTAAGALSSINGRLPGVYYVVPGSTLIYFPLSEAGKTVEFDHLTYTGSDNAVHQVSSLTAPISDAADNNGDVFVDLGPNGANLPSYSTNPSGAQLTPLVVRGVSARAVVIWRERGIWKQRRIDTLLTATQ